MSVANVSQGNVRGLPQALMMAQEAIQLPEVQEMLRKLSEYKLGIFMPHMHHRTGAFEVLPDNVMQVESSLEVSFQSTEITANQPDRFLPVAWYWREGAAIPVSACEMASEDDSGGTERYEKHRM